MTIRGARIERVKLAVNNSVKGHGARPGADHRRENQSESPPTRPAAIFPRGHQHRRQREGQRKNRVRETNEAAPLPKR